MDVHEDQYPVRIIAKLADSKFVWSGRIVHYLLCRQLRVYKKKIWSLVVDQSIKFSLHEFSEITRPKLDELRSIFRGYHLKVQKIFYDEAMSLYPWGPTAYEMLVDSIKMLYPQGRPYTIDSMKNVLQVWAYESVTWRVKRTRASFATVISEDIRDHGEVRKKQIELKKQEADLKKQKTAELRKQYTDLKKKKAVELRKQMADLKKQGAKIKKEYPATRKTRAGVIRIPIRKQIKDDSGLEDVIDAFVVAENKLLSESDEEKEEMIKSARIKFYREKCVHDYKMFKLKPKQFKFKGSGYEELTNSRIPPDILTNLKWLEDVDHLYRVNNIRGDHWVGFHVDLLKQKIDGYDPIFGHVTSEIGDCGMYSLKFIECLALGITFDGINDQNIHGLWVNMAEKTFNEGGYNLISQFPV
ncbi:hypothetical protein N665_0421s0010 [Sinapis alba]|nr:hypothetical protein N665_0421s0010 [Sinapis alba]